MGFAEFPGHPHKARSPSPTARGPSKLSPHWQAAWPRCSLSPSGNVQARLLGLRDLLHHRVRCAARSCPRVTPVASVGFSTLRMFALAHRWAPHRWGSCRPLSRHQCVLSRGPVYPEVYGSLPPRGWPSAARRTGPPEPPAEAGDPARAVEQPRGSHAQRPKPLDTGRSTPPTLPESREPGLRNPRRDPDRRPARPAHVLHSRCQAERRRTPKRRNRGSRPVRDEPRPRAPRRYDPAEAESPMPCGTAPCISAELPTPAGAGRRTLQDEPEVTRYPETECSGDEAGSLRISGPESPALDGAAPSTPNGK